MGDFERIGELKKLAEYMLDPMLNSFDKGDMGMALDKELYLPEFVLDTAPYYMDMLLKYCDNIPRVGIQAFSVEHVMEWMKSHQEEKYRWFKCGGEEEKERIRWLKWNIEGFKIFILDNK